MAQISHSPNKSTNRRKRGFQAASSVLAKQVQKAAEGRGFAVTRLLTHWPEVAGEQLARQTRPVRISYGRGGIGATLILLTTGPAAPMVEMQLPQLRERINACYGYNAIQKISLTQTAASGFAEGQAQFTAAPREMRPPDPEAQAEARQVAGQFEDPQLAEAMARLTLNISSRSNRKDSSC
ncbi:DUF721 domain-containing protein [Paracoccus onubensis]|uniref:DUF721 domain-containing protein n=1 Tax=Paracoccus onubensis TaxID=1675788 RepID=A0A418SRA1_9RHOB|nr:DUF721 domain-containing protein [Paracoccus onubensis]RJE83476.1 DUF721 domain-containing protein [Paracoccus onubensis]